MHLFKKNAVYVAAGLAVALHAAPLAAEPAAGPAATYLERRAQLTAGRQDRDPGVQAAALADSIAFHSEHDFFEEAYAAALDLAQLDPVRLVEGPALDQAHIAFLLSRQTADPLDLAAHRLADPRHDRLWRLVAAARDGDWQSGDRALDSVGSVQSLSHFGVGV